VTTCFLSIVITMSEQMISSAVAQRIIVKFLSNEQSSAIKHAQGSRCMAGDKSFKEGRTDIKNMPRQHLLQRMLWPVFFGLSICLINRFSDGITNHQSGFLKTE
jgi:hypothetical protein